MIYLASTSLRRKKILKQLGVTFKVIHPDYGEKKPTGKQHASPATLVKKHSLAKAVSCASKVEEGMILGSDTIVYFSGKIIGKPKNLTEAFNILKQLQGSWHTVYTGVAVLRVQKHKIFRKKVFAEKTRVRLKPMSHIAIQSYLKKINPLDKAGAYAIQSNRTSIIAEVRGSLSNAIGLPVERLKQFLV